MMGATVLALFSTRDRHNPTACIHDDALPLLVGTHEDVCVKVLEASAVAKEGPAFQVEVFQVSRIDRFHDSLLRSGRACREQHNECKYLDS